MTAETGKTTTGKRFMGFGSNLILGFLVSALSVLTATANYMAYQSGNVAADYETEGDRLLALSNTEYIRATQFIILDYTMFDGEFIQRDVDDFAADYYRDNFSAELQASVDRGSSFDDQYYEEMYAESDQTFDEAFDNFDKANAEGGREAGFQLAMLIAAVGLAFSAYASLLNDENRLRWLFALLSFILMLFSAWQFIVVTFA